MRNVTNLLLIVIALSFTLNGCGTSPSVAPTLTMTSMSPMLTPVLPTPTIAPIAIGKTIVVSSTEDTGEGTLRQALLDANAGDIITFDPVVFPPSDPNTIFLNSGLELNQGNITIDASNSGVILDGGHSTSPDTTGMSITSSHNTIRGLLIVAFPNAGINLGDNAKYNVIGGDRDIGTGPMGQGNLISNPEGVFGINLTGEGTSDNTIQGNFIGIILDGSATWGHSRDGIHLNGANHNLITGNVIGGNEGAGVYLCCAAEGGNVVTDNIIGTDESRTNVLGNEVGIILDRTSQNVIGPSNIIQYNNASGIAFWDDTYDNIVTENSVYDNEGLGIECLPSSSSSTAPRILDFDLQAGNVVGWTCSNCVVEIFSTSTQDGEIYEGTVTADVYGNFAFSRGEALSGPFLTATARSPGDNTSEFSPRTFGLRGLSILQEGNDLPETRIVTTPYQELADNRIGHMNPVLRRDDSGPFPEDNHRLRELLYLGAKWMRFGFDDMELEGIWNQGHEDYSKFEITEWQENTISLFVEYGVTMICNLNYWDENFHTENWPDYGDEDEVQRFLEYTRFIVDHFKGRIQYYEILNEAVAYVDVEDYVNLVHQAIPVIHEVDPEAKIVVGGATDLRHTYSRDYLFGVLQSDIMPIVDAIAIHPMYGASPQYDELREYYYDYPSLVQEIKDTATVHGFKGEYLAEEMVWRTPANPNPYEQPSEYTDTVAAKYYARGIVMNLGMNVWAGTTGVERSGAEDPFIVRTIRNLSEVMAGARAIELPIEILSEYTNIKSYSFSLPNDENLIVLWTDGVAVDNDPGVPSTLTLPGHAGLKATGVDVLHGFEQELISSNENGYFVIRDFLLKDYPIFIRLSN